MNRLLGSAAAGLLMLAAGCGGRGDAFSKALRPSTTDPAAIWATTMPTTGAAGAPGRPTGKVDEVTLKRVALALDDLATGFAEDPITPDEEKNFHGACGHPTVSSRVPPASHTFARFSKGTFGPIVQEQLSSFQDIAAAQKYVATVRSDANCKTFKDGESIDGTPNESTLGALNIGSHGDETVAYRVSGSATADIAYVRLGSVIIQVTTAGVAIDSDLILATLKKAIQKASSLR